MCLTIFYLKVDILITYPIFICSKYKKNGKISFQVVGKMIERGEILWCLLNYYKLSTLMVTLPAFPKMSPFPNFLPQEYIFFSHKIFKFQMKQGLHRWLSGQESTCQCRRCRRPTFDPWVRKIPWRRKWQPTPVFLPKKSHGQRSLASCSPQCVQRIRHV